MMRTTVCLLSVAVVWMTATGCVDARVESGTDADSDSDSDTDTDTDSDTDADTDSDADADTGTDADSDSDADTGSETECADPVAGAPAVTSASSLELELSATSGEYMLTFSEDVANVDISSVSWAETSGGPGVLDSVTTVDASTYALVFSGVSYGETYSITVGTEIADTCGTPLASPFTIAVGWAALSCPLPNDYTTGVPFTGSYDTDELCSPGSPSYHLWDLADVHASAICLQGTYYTESCCDTFYIKDGASSTVYSTAGSGSFSQVVEDDQAITCVVSDYSINYDGYTVTSVTWF